MNKNFKLGFSAIIASVVLGAMTGVASATTVSLTAYNATAADLDLRVDITVAGGVASFEFTNHSTNASAGSVAASIYFESGLASLGLSNPSLSGSGVDFSTSYPGPASPPSGNNVNWASEFYAIGASSPAPTHGLGVGDMLLVTFDYSGNLGDLLAAVTDSNGNSRITAHVLDCVGGNSCAAVSTAVVPLPAGLPLLLGALGMLGLTRRRQN